MSQASVALSHGVPSPRHRAITSPPWLRSTRLPFVCMQPTTSLHKFPLLGVLSRSFSIAGFTTLSASGDGPRSWRDRRGLALQTRQRKRCRIADSRRFAMTATRGRQPAHISLVGVRAGGRGGTVSLYISRNDTSTRQSHPSRPSPSTPSSTCHPPSQPWLTRAPCPAPPSGPPQLGYADPRAQLQDPERRIADVRTRDPRPETRERRAPSPSPHASQGASGPAEIGARRYTRADSGGNVAGTTAGSVVEDRRPQPRGSLSDTATARSAACHSAACQPRALRPGEPG